MSQWDILEAFALKCDTVHYLPAYLSMSKEILTECLLYTLLNRISFIFFLIKPVHRIQKSYNKGRAQEPALILNLFQIHEKWIWDLHSLMPETEFLITASCHADAHKCIVVTICRPKPVPTGVAKLTKDSSDTAHCKHSARQDFFRAGKQYSFLCMTRWRIFKMLTK